MPDHDFSYLFAQYPDVIRRMPEVFTSHQFILELAHRCQSHYIEALYSYRHHEHRGAPAPFMMVHSILAGHLTDYSQLIEQTRKETPSEDIFGRESWCSEWRKLIWQIGFDI